MENTALWSICVLLVGLLIFSLYKMFRSPTCCKADLYNQGTEFLELLAKNGYLAQDIQKLQQQLEQEKEKTKLMIEEIHSLVFFRYLPPKYEKMFKTSLEQKQQSFAQQAQNAEFAKDELLAKAEVLNQLLKILSLSWHEEQE